MENLERTIKEKLGSKILKFYQPSERRIYIDLDPKDIVEIAVFLFKELGCRFSIASGVDTPQGIEILYHFSHDRSGVVISPRVLIKDKKNPEIDSITPQIKAVEWIEREMRELLGINFKNHPNLKRLLLPEDWPVGNYPLRRT